MPILYFPDEDPLTDDHWLAHWRREQPGAAFSSGTSLGAIGQAIVAMADVAEGVVLVGHGSGATTIARLSEAFPHLPVKGALLVAPREYEATSEARGAKGRMPTFALPYPAICVASRNDPAMSYERARFCARCWDVDLVDLGFAGHIDPANGFGPWPQGRLLLDRVMGVRTRPFLAYSRARNERLPAALGM